MNPIRSLFLFNRCFDVLIYLSSISTWYSTGLIRKHGSNIHDNFGDENKDHGDGRTHQKHQNTHEWTIRWPHKYTWNDCKDTRHSTCSECMGVSVRVGKRSCEWVWECIRRCVIYKCVIAKHMRWWSWVLLEGVSEGICLIVLFVASKEYVPVGHNINSTLTCKTKSMISKNEKCKIVSIHKPKAMV